MAAESVLVPTAFSSAHWSGDDAGVHATWRIGDHRETVDLDIGDDGRLRGVLMQRWGKPGGAPFGRYPFGVAVESEREFGGVTIPTEVRAGWFGGTPTNRPRASSSAPPSPKLVGTAAGSLGVDWLFIAAGYS